MWAFLCEWVPLSYVLVSPLFPTLLTFKVQNDLQETSLLRTRGSLFLALCSKIKDIPRCCDMTREVASGREPSVNMWPHACRFTPVPCPKKCEDEVFLREDLVCTLAALVSSLLAELLVCPCTFKLAPINKLCQYYQRRSSSVPYGKKSFKIF